MATKKNSIKASENGVPLLSVGKNNEGERIEKASKKLSTAINDAKTPKTATARTCHRCGSNKTAHQTNGKARWFSVQHGGFSKIESEPVLCEKCQRHDRQELKRLNKA